MLLGAVGKTAQREIPEMKHDRGMVVVNVCKTPTQIRNGHSLVLRFFLHN
jgi:hypothetical protein